MAEPRTPPLRLAFLGCGEATRMHSRTLARMPVNVERYYASREGARSRDACQRLGGAGAFACYSEAIRDERIDAVLIATPPALHLELALMAIDAGKHVIVEKPAFPRVTDFDSVRALLRTSPATVLVAENYAYKPLTARLRRIIRSGRLGRIRFLRINAVKRQSYEDWRGSENLTGGGALLEGGIHWIALLSSLGLEIEAITGFRAGSPYGPDRSIVVVVQYENGGVATLDYSWEIPSVLRGLRLSQIYGTAGTLCFETNGLFMVETWPRRRIHWPGLRDIAGYRAMFHDLLRSIRTGKPPRYTLNDAERDTGLVELATTSALLPLP